jgi:hypothetical protein
MTLMCRSRLSGLRSHDINTSLINTDVMRRYIPVAPSRGGNVDVDAPVSFAMRLMTALILTVVSGTETPVSEPNFFGSGFHFARVGGVKPAEQTTYLTHRLAARFFSLLSFLSRDSLAAHTTA